MGLLKSLFSSEEVTQHKNYDDCTSKELMDSIENMGFDFSDPKKMKENEKTCEEIRAELDRRQEELISLFDNIRDLAGEGKVPEVKRQIEKYHELSLKYNGEEDHSVDKWIDIACK